MNWYFYRLADGVFTGGSYRGPEAMLQANTPEGCGAAALSIDPRDRQRIDLLTGDLVAYQPPAPADDEFRTWSWSEDLRAYIATSTQAGCARDMRAQRDGLLAACDWVVARAVEQAEPVPEPWATYRQALRDIPQQPGFPTTVDWPTPPA